LVLPPDRKYVFAATEEFAEEPDLGRRGALTRHVGVVGGARAALATQFFDAIGGSRSELVQFRELPLRLLDSDVELGVHRAILHFASV
jgi:hypothetical protein